MSGAQPDPAVLASRLFRAEARVRMLERMFENKTRDLYFSNRALQGSNAYLEGVYAVMPGALLIVRGDGTVAKVSRATLTLLGYERDDLTGASIDRVRPVGRAVATLERRAEEQWTAADGSTVPVSVAMARVPGGEDDELLLVGLDLREQRRLEVELRHAQKLESLGQLAAGVAHEINTPMQFIGDNVAFARDGVAALLELLSTQRAALADAGLLDAGAPLTERLDELENVADLEFLRERLPRSFSRVLEGVERVSGIVSALKSFSHPQTEKCAVDLAAAIQTTLIVARNEYKYVADVVTALEPVPPVFAHGGDVHQVLLNLVVNAAHAIADARRERRGTIRVACRVDGDDVVVEVGDDGTGIPIEIQHRVFDPFFTTKAVGRGTGQGLALAHAVVDRHGGTIGFDSRPDEGTTFVIRLPRSDANLQERAA